VYPVELWIYSGPSSRNWIPLFPHGDNYVPQGIIKTCFILFPA